MNILIAILTSIGISIGSYLVDFNLPRAFGMALFGFIAICAYELNRKIWNE